jgi:hypothetical protein
MQDLILQAQNHSLLSVVVLKSTYALTQSIGQASRVEQPPPDSREPEAGGPRFRLVVGDDGGRTRPEDMLKQCCRPAQGCRRLQPIARPVRGPPFRGAVHGAVGRSRNRREDSAAGRLAEVTRIVR